MTTSATGNSRNYDEAKKRISHYLVGFIGERTIEGKSVNLGSGTLVQINDIHGILTAAHVVEKIKSAEKGAKTSVCRLFCRIPRH